MSFLGFLAFAVASGTEGLFARWYCEGALISLDGAVEKLLGKLLGLPVVAVGVRIASDGLVGVDPQPLGGSLAFH